MAYTNWEQYLLRVLKLRAQPQYLLLRIRKPRAQPAHIMHVPTLSTRLGTLRAEEVIIGNLAIHTLRLHGRALCSQ